MCTLIIGRDILAPGTVMLAANRDERPERPSEAPVLLGERPRVVGGRDGIAGGTWLAVRDGRAAVAMLNRRDPQFASPPPDRRSRGLLALDVAAVADDGAEPPRSALMTGGSGDPLAHLALARAFQALETARYAPFSLVFATSGQTWLLAQDHDAPPRSRVVPLGWHVITHAELDDETEPRTERLLYELAYFRPHSLEQAEQRLMDLLRSHGGTPGPGNTGRFPPPVCLHDGVMRTVSSTIVTITRDGARLVHSDGRPCEHPFVDHTALLTAAPHTAAG